MSYINFHFPDETCVRVRGNERASFGLMTEHHARGAIGLTYGINPSHLIEDLALFINPAGPLAKFLQPDPDLTMREQFDRALGSRLYTMSFISTGAPFAWKGVEINTRQLIMNTVLATGSDPMRMAVKIHFQCEIHGYLMGFHRKWLADLVDEGLEEGIYRRAMGWEELSAKLREAAQGPVVTSFSGSDGFPDRAVANWRGSLEDWNGLGSEKQWALAVKGLKAPGRNRPWAPDTLRSYRFGHDLSLLDLLRADTERVEKGLKIT